MWRDQSKVQVRQKSIAKQVPYDRDENNTSEAQWYRCRHCGFVCSDKRDEHGTRGDGCSYETVTITEYDGTEHTGVYKATVNSGCPLCGSHTWKG